MKNAAPRPGHEMGAALFFHHFSRFDRISGPENALPSVAAPVCLG
jgi:hypothetical protein